MTGYSTGKGDLGAADTLPNYIIGPQQLFGMVRVSERLRNALGEKPGRIPQDQTGKL
jgi:hypothetical protein